MCKPLYGVKVKFTAIINTLRISDTPSLYGSVGFVGGGGEGGGKASTES